jgi:hypothetical protein
VPAARRFDPGHRAGRRDHHDDGARYDDLDRGADYLHDAPGHDHDDGAADHHHAGAHHDDHRADHDDHRADHDDDRVADDHLHRRPDDDYDVPGIHDDDAADHVHDGKALVADDDAARRDEPAAVWRHDRPNGPTAVRRRPRQPSADVEPGNGGWLPLDAAGRRSPDTDPQHRPEGRPDNNVRDRS